MRPSARAPSPVLGRPQSLRPPCGHFAQIAVLHRWPYCTGGCVAQGAVLHGWPHCLQRAILTARRRQIGRGLRVNAGTCRTMHYLKAQLKHSWIEYIRNASRVGNRALLPNALLGAETFLVMAYGVVAECTVGRRNLCSHGLWSCGRMHC